MENSRYDYVTSTLSLAVNETVNSEKITVPDGKVVAIAAIVAGNTEDRVINLSILQNNMEVVKAADVRFSAKTSGGTFKDSMRPVDLSGGRTYETKIVASAASTTETVQIQVLFMIEKPN